MPCLADRGSLVERPQAYSDRSLRVFGMVRRYKRRCIDMGRFACGLGVVFACVVLNLAASGILPVEIAPWELDRWRVRPA
ncbi:Ubiquitin-conjugating enzyme E2 Z [Durusdinium trenchii]|uniref:Ubiquitin-conjugating enzyme E2 Z n=1 Tax=Durusdinium trenchii TaxID=1381693 RepID=A0ABP0SAW7_9DINO